MNQKEKIKFTALSFQHHRSPEPDAARAQLIRKALAVYGEADSNIAFFGSIRPESASILQAILDGFGSYLPLGKQVSIFEAAEDVYLENCSVLFYTAERAAEVEEKHALFPGVRLFVDVDRLSDSPNFPFLSFRTFLASGRNAKKAG